MATGVAILLASFLLPGAFSVPVRAVLAGLAQAPISAVAEVAGKDLDVVLASLKATYPDVRAAQSLADLAGGDTEAGIGLVGQLFAEAPAPQA